MFSVMGLPESALSTNERELTERRLPRDERVAGGVGWGVRRSFKEEESVSRRRAWSVVSKTDDTASQTALFASDSGREKLKNKLNEGGCI